MEEMTKARMLLVLRKANPLEREDDLRVYATAMTDWLEAEGNIRENGLIALHPKSGAPFSNPYVAVRDKAAAVMLSLRLVKTATLWDAVDGASNKRAGKRTRKG